MKGEGLKAAMNKRFLAIGRHLPRRALLFGPCLAAALALSVSLPQLAAAPPSLDDVPQPFVPQHQANEADRDRVEALSLFAAGRAHEKREQFAQALRCYQRALRLDPDSSTIAPAIIPLAVRLKRYDEAARYVLLPGKIADVDPLQIRQLGVHLTQANDLSRAAAVYEKALTADEKPPAVLAVVLWKELGDLYLTSSDYKRAANCFAKLLDAVDHPTKNEIDSQLKGLLFPDGAQSFQLIGECFLAADRPQDAKGAFERAENIAPNKAMRQLNLARVQLKSGKPAETLAALESAIAERLTDVGAGPYETMAETLKTLEETLKKLGRQGELIARLEKLRAAEPKSAPLGYFLASQYAAAGKPEKAESLYLELLKTNPTSAGYRELLDLYRRAKRFDAMLETQGDAVEKLGLMNALWDESLTAAEKQQVGRGIVEAAKKKLQANRDKLTRGMRLAAALREADAQEHATAAEFFDLALATKPKQADEVFMVWGLGLLTNDRADDAAKVFQRAIDEEVAADDSILHFYLAGALSLAGKTDEALAAAKVAAKKNPKSPRFCARPAWVLYFGKRNDAAMKEYGELLDRFDAERDSPEAREAMHEARMALSNLCAMKGDTAKAEEWLEQVLDEFPDDKGAMNDLGYLWADANKHLGRAKRMIQAAVDAEPKNMAYRDSLGWLLYRQNQFAAAVAELEKAAAAENPDGTVLDHLGDAYEKAGQHEKALASWRKAVELLRKDKETDKAISVQKKLR